MSYRPTSQLDSVHQGMERSLHECIMFKAGGKLAHTSSSSEAKDMKWLACHDDC